MRFTRDIALLRMRGMVILVWDGTTQKGPRLLKDSQMMPKDGKTETTVVG